MPSILQQLPTVLVVGALVAIFLSIQRHNRTPRLRMWVVGWGIIFFHLVLTLLPRMQHVLLEHVYETLAYATLGVAGLAFLISVTTLVNSESIRTRVLVIMSVPMILYTTLLGFESAQRGVYFVLAFWMAFGGASWFFLWYRKLNSYVAANAGFLFVIGIIALVRVVQRDYESAFYVLLMGMYAMSSFLFIKRNPRLSPGVILTSGGFLAWAVVWALGAFASAWLMRAGTNTVMWDVPKFFVGFGMIVTLLEDQYLSARAAGRRERILNVQMARFADFTTKLLGGVEVRSLCGEIARVINEVANFRRVAIVLLGDNGRLSLAGWAGIDEATREHLDKTAGRLSPEVIAELCAKGRRIATDSYIYSREVAEQIGSVISKRRYGPNPHWSDGDELMIPLRTGRGNIVGCISLDDPKSVYRVTPEEISKIEMLANDLGVAIEKNTLQQKVMLHEKLASVGQLVSGVAHELNNPLTAVMGYTELLADSEGTQPFHREIGVIRREAQRMKTIIDNLLRFSRQTRTETRAVRLETAMREALTLRQYDITRNGIALEQRIEANLPHIACDEAQFKTVLVHLLNNAIDAVKESEEKKLEIDARRIGDRVILSLSDTGPGFQDVQRIFDPFFTTKGVGRGTGLGLSICYGIIKQHGGEIYAQNIKPHGACITMELLVATSEAKPAASGN